MLLAQKQTHRSMEQNRWLRNESILIRSINLQQRIQEYTVGNRQPLQYMVLGKLDSYMQKNKVGLLAHTIYSNKLKRVKDLNVRPETIKVLEENIDSTLSDTGLSNFFWICLPPQGKQKQK